MFHLNTFSVPTDCIYDKYNALLYATPFSIFPPLPTIMSCASAWVMLNGPCWCNRSNYCMWCPNWILRRPLIHKVSEKYFARRKNQCMSFISRPRPLSAIRSISKWTNLLRCSKLKSNLHVEPFSNCAPPHTALTCAIIQGGMDSNSPLRKVAQALSRVGNPRHRMRSPSRAAAGCKEKRIQAE